MTEAITDYKTAIHWAGLEKGRSGYLWDDLIHEAACIS